jgi:hypothetical protein
LLELKYKRQIIVEMDVMVLSEEIAECRSVFVGLDPQQEFTFELGS